MKRLLFILATFSLTIMVVAATPESQALARTERKIDALFKSLKSVSNTNTSPATVSKIKYDFENYFMSADQHCPNEFKNIWQENNSATALATDIRPARYFDLFFHFFRDDAHNNSTFSYEHLNSCLVKEPEFKKNEEPAKLVQVVIRKVYSRNGEPFATFKDTLVVGLEEMKIRAWSNDASRHSIGYFGGEDLDIEQSKASAALAYSNKQYDKAYHIYQSIVTKYPQEGDPYYRMAIMLYKEEYGSSINKKERNRLILEYLHKAILNGSSSTRHCADNMKYWITC